jgi:sporulation integral membrane protein YtvI
MGRDGEVYVVIKKERPFWHVILSLFFSLLATGVFLLLAYHSIIILMPFVIGWLVALIATPMVNFLERRVKINKPFASAIIIVLTIAVIVVGLYFAIAALINQLSSFADFVPTALSQMEAGFAYIGETYTGIVEMLPEGIREALSTIGMNIQESIVAMITNLGQPTVEAAGNIAQNIPHFIVSFFVSLMASYFLIVYRKEVTELFARVTPESITTRMVLVRQNFKTAIGGYFKAQLQIMAVVFVILFFGLLIGGVQYFVLFAFLIALLDVLPIFGTGTVLIPWGIYQLLVGDVRMAIILAVTYILTQIAHNLLQPKLVSDGMGIHPLFALFLLYIGFYFGNFITMILAVPAGMIIVNLYKAGAFEYITSDMKIIIAGVLSMRGEPNPNFTETDKGE